MVGCSKITDEKHFVETKAARSVTLQTAFSLEQAVKKHLSIGLHLELLYGR